MELFETGFIISINMSWHMDEACSCFFETDKQLMFFYFRESDVTGGQCF